MLNQDTRNLLKQLIPINNQMIISENMYGCNEFKSIYFKANLSKIESFKETFGIFDTANFLSALDLLEEPSIDFNQETNMINAKDVNSNMSFLASLVDSLESVKINPKIISSTVAVDSIFEASFTPEILNKIKKAQAVFKNFDTLHIVNQSGKTSIKLGTQNSFSKSNNSFNINLEAQKDEKEFSIAIPLHSLMSLPVMDYTLKVKYNQEKDAYRVVLDNELLVFILSLQKD